MTTSEFGNVFVWTWLPGSPTPVVAGRLDPMGPQLTFVYRLSNLAGCVARAREYGLSEPEARGIIDGQRETIEARWESVCDEAGLTAVDRALLRQRAVLLPYAFEGYSRAG